MKIPVIAIVEISETDERRKNLEVLRKLLKNRSQGKGRQKQFPGNRRENKQDPKVTAIYYTQGTPVQLEQLDGPKRDLTKEIKIYTTCNVSEYIEREI